MAKSWRTRFPALAAAALVLAAAGGPLATAAPRRPSPHARSVGAPARPAPSLPARFAGAPARPGRLPRRVARALRVQCAHPAALRLVRYEDRSARLYCAGRVLVKVGVPY